MYKDLGRRVGTITTVVCVFDTSVLFYCIGKFVLSNKTLREDAHSRDW